jgi:DNA-binding LytR/AlgR family response regulator
MRELAAPADKHPQLMEVLKTGLLLHDAQTGIVNPWPLCPPEKFKIQFAKNYFELTTPDQLIALTAGDKSVMLHLSGGQSGTACTTLVLKKASLVHIAEQLFPLGYIQVHRQSMINLRYLKGVDKNKILLTCTINKDIKIGSSYDEIVEQLIEIYLKRNNCISLLGY